MSRSTKLTVVLSLSCLTVLYLLILVLNPPKQDKSSCCSCCLGQVFIEYNAPSALVRRPMWDEPPIVLPKESTGGP